MSMFFSTAFSYDIAVKNMDGVTIYYWKSSEYGELIVCQNESTDNSYSGRVVIPESVEYNNEIYMVTAIGDYAFEGCDVLTSVTIPSTIITIGWGAFLGCTGLTSVSIPNSVRYIKEGAFDRCSSLTSVIIPSSVKNIDGKPFDGCESLASINVDEDNTKYDSRQGCNAIIETSSNRLIVGCKNTIIPSTVTSIGSNAFANCYGLTSVAFPNSVTTIEEYAFYGCNDLSSLTIPSSVTIIGYEAFHGTAWYNSQPDGLVYAGQVAYKYKGTMPQETNVVINEGTTGIVPYAFTNCRGLTSVSIPNSVKSIGSNSFSGCVCLTSVSIPNSVTSIGYDAFSDTPWYNSQPDGLVYAGQVAYKYKGTISENTEIVIRDGTKGIADGAFTDCYGITSVFIPNSVTNIGNSAFMGCDALTSVIIPSDVARIGVSAFSCNNLTSVTAMMRVPVDIGYSTFANRRDATLYVPAGCKAAYETADYWKEFKEIVEMLDVDNYLEPVNTVACRSGQSALFIAMDNVEQIVGFQFDLQLPEGVTVAANANGMYAASLTNRNADHSLSVSKVGDNLYRFVSVSMNNSSYSGTEGALLNVKLKIGESVAVGSYEVKVKDTELTTADKTVINSIEGTATLTVQDAEPGDVNGDMKVSVTDVSSIIGHILNDTPATFIESAADLNGDNKVSVTDAVIVIGKILNDGNVSNARKMVQTEREPQ